MIRVGLIGAGFIGRNHFNQYEKLADRAKVVALCDRDAERRAGDWSKVGGNIGDAQGTKRDLGSIRPYTEWQDLLADREVDMVDICIPTVLHREISVAALKAGKHALCEKPMALSVEDCDEMIRAAAASTGRFMIAQCIRFWPEYAFLKRVFDDRRYGELKALHLRRQTSTPSYSLNNWIVNPEVSGGAVLDLHVHDVDFALYLLGKPTSLVAQGYCRPSGAMDRIHALWNYDRELVVQLEGFWDLYPGFDFNMGFSAAFENASIVWDCQRGEPLRILTREAEPQTPQLPATDGYYGEIDYFLHCIERGENPTVTTPQQSREAVALALMEKQSAETRQPVQVG